MSTRIGTLHAPRTTRSIWPAAVIASLLMLTVGIGVFFLARDQATPTAKTVAVRGAAEASGELSAGTTAANTPSELSGGIRHKYVGAAVGANTPSELSEGLGNGLPARIYDRHQRR